MPDQTMSPKLQEAGMEVATVNPGPFVTGFNDRDFQTWASWEGEPSERLHDHTKLAFPRAQHDPEPVYAAMTAVAAGKVGTFRDVEPKSMFEKTKRNMEAVWDKKLKDGLGTRPAAITHSMRMRPETPMVERWRGQPSLQ